MPVFYADPRPIFTPAMRLIASITNSNPGVVETTFPHGYISGLVVRMIVPQRNGMYEINHLEGAIRVLTPTTFSIDIDTQFFEPFVIPAYNSQLSTVGPQVVPIGEINSMLTGAVQNILPFQ